jgi:hypothetical protein
MTGNRARTDFSELSAEAPLEEVINQVNKIQEEVSRISREKTPYTMTFEFVPGNGYPKWKNPLKTKPIAVIIGEIIEKTDNPPVLTAGQVYWTYNGESITIEGIDGLTNASTYSVNFVVF